MAVLFALGFSALVYGQDDQQVMADFGFSNKNEMDFIGAASEGDLKKVGELLAAGLKINGTYGILQQTALTMAANQGRLEMVKFLIRSGADVNQHGSLGWPPLMHAANNGHLEVVRHLIDHGADVNATDHNGFTVLQQSSRYPEITQVLKDAGAKEPLEQQAGSLMDRATTLIKQERYEEASATIDEWEKADPKNAQIPLWREMIAGLRTEPDPKRREELALQFLNHQMGALVDTMDTTSQLLTQLNQKLDALGPQNPGEELCGAVAEGNQAKVEVLIAKGVSANSKDRFGDTALGGAAWRGDAEMVQILLFHGADVNGKGLLENTPLISAALKGSVDTVRVLLAAGVDPNAKGKTGAAALSVAIKGGHSKVAEILRQAGAKE